MDHIAVQLLLLLVGLAGWIYCSFPMLRYMVDWTEGRYRWQLLLWFVLIALSIFILKFALYSIVGWPSPGSWASRLFFGFALILSYSFPFIREWLRGIRSR